MTDSDPFATYGDDDKTILRPSPGGRRRQASVMSKAPVQYPGRLDTDARTDFMGGDNPFITHAFALLSLVPKFRSLPFHPAVNELQAQLVDEIRRFEQRLQKQGIRPEQVRIASYFLCTLIDETVLNTPWGNQSSWGQHSLLIQFHREAKGGERFFEILERLQSHPSDHLDLLELAYLCLSLGFEGKYQLAERGLRDLDQLRQQLYILIQRTKDEFEQPLSSHWQGLRDMRAPIAKHVPYWVGVVVAGAVLMLIYMGFAYAINRFSNRTYKHLAEVTRENIKAPPPRVPTTTAPPRPAVDQSIRMDRFERLLSSEIASGIVEVVDGNILRISNAFPSGSDRIKKTYIPVLEKIARELGTDTRRITVIGHTDNRPIFSARFPSNWDLSQARAKYVANILMAAARLNGRVRFEGRADNEPIVSNDTPANRARNRRIDIQIR
jgi:type VI secretion system protein ImpK